MRVSVFDHQGAPLYDIPLQELFGLKRTETLNGQNALTITTAKRLQQGQRVVLVDSRDNAHEYIVMGTDESHTAGKSAIGTYYCPWSLQGDLMGTRVSRMPGRNAPVSALVALQAVLSGTDRWTVGTVTNVNTGAASMYDTDGWSALKTLVQIWGGDVSASFTVEANRIKSRSVNLYAHMGATEPARRFDFGADLRSVTRRIPDGPLYCRIAPRGRGEYDEETGGYGRKITIESVNDGRDYLENPAMVEMARLPSSSGWEYPTLEVDNPNMETPADLMAWAQSILAEKTVPQVSYEVDVLQAGFEGIDAKGVMLGDEVQIVDSAFDGLRMQARVLEITHDELTGAQSTLTLGAFTPGLSDRFGDIGSTLSVLSDTVLDLNGGTFSTAGYVDRLLNRLNTDINSTGGYTYIVPGSGIRTYDAEVSDPAVGAEASAVVEMKGGTIRIANSKDATGAWEWRTVFTSGHIAADLVTAAAITAGFIGSAASGNFWNLDTGVLQIASNATLGGESVSDVLADVAAPNALIRTYGNGVLVCRAGNSVGALVNANGTFDVVSVTWTDGNPTVGAQTLASFGEAINIGSGFGLYVAEKLFSLTLEGMDAFRIQYNDATSSAPWNMLLDFYQTFQARMAANYYKRYVLFKAPVLNVTPTATYELQYSGTINANQGAQLKIGNLLGTSYGGADDCFLASAGGDTIEVTRDGCYEITAAVTFASASTGSASLRVEDYNGIDTDYVYCQKLGGSNVTLVYPPRVWSTYEADEFAFSVTPTMASTIVQSSSHVTIRYLGLESLPS